ncbi:MAG: Coenzyme F420 hydrogenase/dehydrogenase, beta subunit C-terminal domain [Pseudomonadota bacterium]
MRHPNSVKEVVENGLCIGCGLCAALGPFEMTYTEEGRLRPKRIGPGEETTILAACPGAVAAPNQEKAAFEDPIWGSYHSIEQAWARDPDLRFRASTGGVLTALSQHLLRSGQARFILHCAADPEQPLRSRWVLSETPEEVSARAGSRYGPTDTLAGLEAALRRAEPFAIVAKPCDAGAVRAYARQDPRVERYLVALLVMVCGGASDLGKSQALLQDLRVSEEAVTLFRYRGYGNPGPTRVETRSGEAFEVSYQEMWADESGWRVQTRCKLCPDALGEAADLAAADIWPGAEPAGEDAGFNGVITRTAAGEALFREALAAGALVSGGTMTAEAMSDTQPHQVRKKRAMAARLRGMAAAGSPVYAHQDLRLAELDGGDLAEEEGTKQRVLSGRFRERMPE